MADDQEAFYDAEVAPVLMDLARKCEDEGLSFLAVVEWSPGNVGRTVRMSADASVMFKLPAMAAASKGNADALIIQMLADGKKHGHNSAYLHLIERGGLA